MHYLSIMERPFLNNSINFDRRLVRFDMVTLLHLALLLNGPKKRLLAEIPQDEKVAILVFNSLIPFFFSHVSKKAYLRFPCVLFDLKSLSIIYFAVNLEENVSFNQHLHCIFLLQFFFLNGIICLFFCGIIRHKISDFIHHLFNVFQVKRWWYMSMRCGQSEWHGCWWQHFALEVGTWMWVRLSKILWSNIWNKSFLCC